MIQRLIKIIKSLSSSKVIKDDTISTTIDDTKEGKRLTFNKDIVENILLKTGLINIESDETVNKEKRT